MPAAASTSAPSASHVSLRSFRWVLGCALLVIVQVFLILLILILVLDTPAMRVVRHELEGEAAPRTTHVVPLSVSASLFFRSPSFDHQGDAYTSSPSSNRHSGLDAEDAEGDNEVHVCHQCKREFACRSKRRRRGPDTTRSSCCFTQQGSDFFRFCERGCEERCQRAAAPRNNVAAAAAASSNSSAPALAPALALS